ncbi:MAG: hypothetical protein OSA98_14815 [Rubripirellula sp.]|nr:hypothetical protein [Rubripirellula sp.]
MTSSTSDRNLLFGILALQMDFMTRDGLIDAMQAWTLVKTQSLGELLDIPKTMVSLYGCGAEDIADSHGFDLMPLLQGGSFEREYAHAEQHGVNLIQNEDFKLVSY